MIRITLSSRPKLFRVINVAHLFGVTWLLSITAFAGVLLHAIFASKGITEQHSTALVFVVLTGLFAFLGALLLYLIHFLFLRKKSTKEHSRSSRIVTALLVTLVILFIGVVAIKGAYNLGKANEYRGTQNTSESTNTPTPVVTEKGKYIQPNKVVAEPSPTSFQNAQQQNNLVSCYVYGQTFNLTPEKCRYYQSEEGGANKALNSGSYTPPTQYGTTQTSTPIPTSAPDKYHSAQEDCRKSCYSTYQNYPDTSLAKQQCVNSCN